MGNRIPLTQQELEALVVIEEHLRADAALDQRLRTMKLHRARCLLARASVSPACRNLAMVLLTLAVLAVSVATRSVPLLIALVVMRALALLPLFPQARRMADTLRAHGLHHA
jgi:hypothetical protein